MRSPSNYNYLYKNPISLPAQNLRFETPLGQRPRQFNNLYLYAFLFLFSVSCNILNHYVSDYLHFVSYMLAILGCVPCGLAWLLSRELFRGSAAHVFWPTAVVITFFALSIAAYIAGQIGLADSGFIIFIGKLNTLLGSAVLLLTLLEPIDGFANEGKRERRFRISFMLGYGALLATSFSGLLPSPSGDASILPLMAIFGTLLAVYYRAKHPIIDKNRKQIVDLNPSLASSIQLLIKTEKPYLNPEIRVSNLADSLKQPEYKVTQCITHDLGYKNFNQMINTYRIEEAIGKLKDESQSNCSILSIALDSGFGSIGPFNRAFKQQTGMTPRAFRLANLSTEQN